MAGLQVASGCVDGDAIVERQPGVSREFGVRDSADADDDEMRRDGSTVGELHACSVMPAIRAPK